MILPENLSSSFRKRFGYYPCPVSRIEQQVIAAFISGGYFERHISRMRRLYRTKRNLMVALFRETFPNIEIRGEEAGLHFIIRFGGNPLSEKEIMERLLEKGLAIKGTGNGWLIVGYAHLTDEEMKTSVQLLKEVLD